MKKRMKLISMAALVLSCMTILCSCGKSDEELIVGRWETDDESAVFCEEIEFFSDGTYATDYASWNGEYSIDDDRIKFDGVLNTQRFTFDVSRKKLVLETNGWNYTTYERR